MTRFGGSVSWVVFIPSPNPHKTERSVFAPPPFTIVHETFFLFSFVRVGFFLLFKTGMLLLPFGIFIQLLKLEFYSFLSFLGFFDFAPIFYTKIVIKKSNDSNVLSVLFKYLNTLVSTLNGAEFALSHFNK